MHSLTTRYSKCLMLSVCVYSSSRAGCRSWQWQSRIPIPLCSHQYPAPHQTLLYPKGIISWSVDYTKSLKKLGVSIFKDEETPEVGSNKFIREICTSIKLHGVATMNNLNCPVQHRAQFDETYHPRSTLTPQTGPFVTAKIYRNI